MTSSFSESDLASVERLLRERVETYDQLEALIWFSTGDGEPHGARDVAEALSLPELAVTDALNALAAKGVLRRVVGSALFRFAPETPELAAAVRKLALLHEQDRVRVIRIMNDHAIARLRSSALQAFGARFRRRPRE